MSKPSLSQPDRMLRKRWQVAALAWLVVCLLCALALGVLWRTERIDTNFLALLPQERSAQAINDVTAHIADSSARQIVVLLGSSSVEDAKNAQSAYHSALGELPANLKANLSINPTQLGVQWFTQAQAYYAPYRDRLLTAKQRKDLAGGDISKFAQSALQNLYSPMGGPRLTQWRADPLGLWPAWWQDRAQQSAKNMDSQGLFQAKGLYWTVVLMNTSKPAFHLDGSKHLSDALDWAAAAAKKADPAVQEIRAGMPLHAEAAASRAAWEMNIIGWGSLASVLALTILTFGSFWPRILVIASLAVGCLLAMTVTLLVFGKVHLMTLVCGASLIGVAEDYGTYWFTSFLGHPQDSSWQLLRRLITGLVLALATSALAYLAMGLIAVPGLQQIAVFSATGLTGAFLTVLLWFPFLNSSAMRPTAFAHWLGDSLRFFPRARVNGFWIAAFAALAIVIVGGLMKLHVQDSLLSLQSSPPRLIQEQMSASDILDLPSPAQFFLVQGQDTQQVLEREEALTTALEDIKTKLIITNWRALSDWLPSHHRQNANLLLTTNTESAVLQKVAASVGQSIERPAFAAKSLELEPFLASDVSMPVRNLWIGSLQGGKASIVMVSGLKNREHLGELAALQNTLPGVRWVDRTAEFSTLLGQYRITMTWLLLAGTVVVWGVLLLRYRRSSWRALLPTVLAGLIALALQGYWGQPLQLFNILALMLLLGIGVDYGIFLIEQRNCPHSWLAVSLGAAGTCLSFGLLSLSATPALHSFGATLLVGLLSVWALSPLFSQFEPKIQPNKEITLN